MEFMVQRDGRFWEGGMGTNIQGDEQDLPVKLDSNACPRDVISPQLG